MFTRPNKSTKDKPPQPPDRAAAAKKALAERAGGEATKVTANGAANHQSEAARVATSEASEASHRSEASSSPNGGATDQR
eukprot:756816-Prorocentrum_minimum.AAC.1